MLDGAIGGDRVLYRRRGGGRWHTGNLRGTRGWHRAGGLLCDKLLDIRHHHAQAFAYGAAVAPAPAPAAPAPSPAAASPPPALTPLAPATADTTQPPAGRPTVRFSARLPNTTPETFSVLDKAAYVAALQLAAQAPVDVYILSITRGSAILDTSVVFASGAAENARRLSDTLSSNPGRVFPAAAYGQVSVSGLTTSNAAKEVPVGAIVGGVVGGFAGLVILGGLVAWLVVRHRRANAPTGALAAPLSQAA